LTNFNENYQNYSLQDPHDIDDVFKVMDSEVKVTNNISQKVCFSDDVIVAYQLTVHQ